MVNKNQDWQKKFEEWTLEIMEEYEIPGLSVGLAHKGEVIYARGFGYACREEEKKAGPATVFGIASITKSFTALAIMLLAREEKLSIGDPVIKYLPEFQVGETITPAITIHHFLTHTAALPPTPALLYAMVRSLEGDPTVDKLKSEGKWEQWTAEPPLDSGDDLLHYLARKKFEPLGHPGGQFSYSNDAYSLLGTIVERVSGMSLGDFMAERIFQPLGMDRTTFDPQKLEDWPDVTQLYARIDEEIMPAPCWNHAPAMLGAGFLKSNIIDLLKYGNFYLNNPSLAGLMGAPLFPLPPGNFYGYGFMVQPDYQGHPIIEHGGSLKGVSSHLGLLPEKDLTAAVLINLVEMPVTRIWNALINSVLDRPLSTERYSWPVLSSWPEGSRDWPGQYTSGEGAEVRVQAEGDKLFIEFNNNRQELHPVAVDKARIIRRGEQNIIQFLRDGSGYVSALHMGLRIIKKDGES